MYRCTKVMFYCTLKHRPVYNRLPSVCPPAVTSPWGFLPGAGGPSPATAFVSPSAAHQFQSPASAALAAALPACADRFSLRDHRHTPYAPHPFHRRASPPHGGYFSMIMWQPCILGAGTLQFIIYKLGVAYFDQVHYFL